MTPTPQALRLRAQHCLVVERVLTDRQFAAEVNMPVDAIAERLPELAGIVERRTIGARWLVYARRRECGCWPSSEEIEGVVGRLRREERRVANAA